MLEWIVNTRKPTRVESYVEMRLPAGLLKIPSLKIACGEKPEVV